MVEYPPYGSVTTLYELIQRAVSLTENADFIGEQDTNAVYQWIKYADVSLSNYLFFPPNCFFISFLREKKNNTF